MENWQVRGTGRAKYFVGLKTKWSSISLREFYGVIIENEKGDHDIGGY